MAVGWLDPPRPGAVEQAERLLVSLGALDAAGAVTDTGRELLRIAAPPRLGRLLVEARRRGAGEAGALLAALAAERDVLLEARAFGDGDDAPWPEGPSDCCCAPTSSPRPSAPASPATCRRLGLDPVALRAVDRARRHYLGRAAGGRGTPAGSSDSALAISILAAFSDRLCRRRAPGSNRAVMVGGAGVVLDPRSAVRAAELFVAVDLDAGAGADARVRIASAVERAWLDELFPGAVRCDDEVVFDDAQQRVVRRARERFHDLVLSERVSPDVDRAAAGVALAAAARRDPAAAAQIDDDARHLLDRLRFLARAMPELGWPAVDALLGDAVEALCDGRRSFAELRRADVGAGGRGVVSGAQRLALEREAPPRLTLPSGRSVAIAYAADKPPAAAARIQEVFGLAATPRLGGGRVPLVLELLAPSQRPVQITDDLASFWRSGYAEVRKQLRGRYPKHAWPEDPTTAEPTSRLPRRR
ncbi:MAG: ATP-dependent helicase C-terminal domain-containing protein [Candidatus Binatia bacterium]